MAKQNQIRVKANQYMDGINSMSSPVLVFVHYIQTDEKGAEKTFSDMLLVNNGCVQEGWDFTDQVLADKPMSVAHPDFKFQGGSVGEFVEKTFNHPNHPGITQITLASSGGFIFLM